MKWRKNQKTTVWNVVKIMTFAIGTLLIMEAKCVHCLKHVRPLTNPVLPVLVDKRIAICVSKQ